MKFVKIWTPEILNSNFSQSSVSSYVISIYFDCKIEFYRENRHTLILLIKHLQLQIIRRGKMSGDQTSGGQLSRGKNITIPCDCIFYVLHSKRHFIQHFKLHENWNWAINVN